VAKVTSKLQVTVPKAIAERYRIRPGDEVEWTPAGDAIRVVPASRKRGRADGDAVGARLKLFDQATIRQQQRQQAAATPHGRTLGRGWTRADLYNRGDSR
jgi:AbrB family looped-hinge helix DNA binding protein